MNRAMKLFTRKYSVKPNDSVNKTFNRISTFARIFLSFEFSFVIVLFHCFKSNYRSNLEGVILHDSISISYTNLTLNSYCLPYLWMHICIEYIYYLQGQKLLAKIANNTKFIKNKICMLRYINIECSIQLLKGFWSINLVWSK